MLRYAHARWGEDARVIVWGHSLGASVAVRTLASVALASSTPAFPTPAATLTQSRVRVDGLILENPFSSTPAMLRALYPQKWLPYHYMGPLVWDTWDALGDVRRAAASASSQMEGRSGMGRGAMECGSVGEEKSTSLEGVLPDMMVLLSARDELVPNEQGRAIWEAARPFRGEGAESGPGQGEAEGESESESGIGRLVLIEKALHEDGWRYKRWGIEMGRYVRDVEVRGTR